MGYGASGRGPIFLENIIVLIATAKNRRMFFLRGHVKKSSNKYNFEDQYFIDSTSPTPETKIKITTKIKCPCSHDLFLGDRTPKCGTSGRSLQNSHIGNASMLWPSCMASGDRIRGNLYVRLRLSVLYPINLFFNLFDVVRHRIVMPFKKPTCLRISDKPGIS